MSTPSSNIFTVLLTASKKIVGDVCRDLTAGGGGRYILKYLDNVANYQLRKSALISDGLIIREIMDDLGKLIDFVARCIECLRQYQTSFTD